MFYVSVLWVFVVEIDRNGVAIFMCWFILLFLFMIEKLPAIRFPCWNYVYSCVSFPIDFTVWEMVHIEIYPKSFCKQLLMENL